MLSDEELDRIRKLAQSMWSFETGDALIAQAREANALRAELAALKNLHRSECEPAMREVERLRAAVDAANQKLATASWEDLKKELRDGEDQA